MRATGFVRRVDDLGRVVLPKEIRRTLAINEGSPLEFFVDGKERAIILKAYAPTLNYDFSILRDFPLDVNMSPEELRTWNNKVEDLRTFYKKLVNQQEGE